MTWEFEEVPEHYRMPEGIGEGARADMRLALDALHQYMQDAEQDAAGVAAHFAAWEAEIAQGVGPLSESDLRDHGYSVEMTERGFELFYSSGPDDYYSVEIEGFGGAAPTEQLAEAEALRRIERGCDR